MELSCGACKEIGIGLDCHGGEESSEVESGGVIEGLRGFQGDPRLGLPLGHIIGCLVQLAEGTKAAWWRGMTGVSSLQRRKTEISLSCVGISPADSEHK